MMTFKTIEFLTNRGLDVETLESFGLHSEQRHGDEWLAIPYMLNGVAVNHKYRKLSDKQFEQDKGGKKIFWNQDAITNPDFQDMPLIITEGEFDAMAAIQCGFLRAVSVPDGAPSEEIGDKESAKYSYIEEQLGIMSGVREIILAVDNDKAGVNLLNDLALRLDKVRCKYIRFPKRKGSDERCKDLNEVLMTYGLVGVSETINRATWMQVDGVYAMGDLPPAVEAQGYRNGMGGLDDNYILRRGDFCVVTGIPGHGKSTFLNDLACTMALKYGWRTAFASFEQSPQTDHKRNLQNWFYAATGIGKSSEADKWINENFRFIVPSDDDTPNLDWVLARCAMAVMQHNCEMIIIDPWNEIDHCKGFNESLTEYTGNAIKKFKRMAKRLNVHLIVAAHPAKMKKEDGIYVPPSLYDISDSAHWANKADVGISVYRPSPSVNRTEIAVLKARYWGINGRVGVSSFSFDSKCRTYIPLVA